RRSLRHNAPDPRVEVLHQHVEDILLALEVQVERPLGDPGDRGDLHDGRVVVTEAGEDLLRGLQQPAAGTRSLLAERLARRVRHYVLVAQRFPFLRATRPAMTPGAHKMNSTK